MSHDLAALQVYLAAHGATKVAHLDGDLLTHMTNVYRCLGRMGRPEHVTLAGLFHGSYGTHALHGQDVFALPEGRRQEVRALIDEEAEGLVHTFCVMTYESLGRSLRNVLKPGGRPALWDRCANRPLDISRERFDDLLWLKFADLLAHVPQLSRETMRVVGAEYGPFWQLVAEYLGPSAVDEWNRLFGELLPIGRR